jgi:hypothetical protein
MNGVKSKSKQILDRIRELKRPACAHDIADIMDNNIHVATAMLSTLKHRGKLVKCETKDKCESFKGFHTFYNYAGNEEMAQRREEKVIPMLNSEIETLKGELIARDRKLGEIAEENRRMGKHMERLIAEKDGIERAAIQMAKTDIEALRKKESNPISIRIGSIEISIREVGA